MGLLREIPDLLAGLVTCLIAQASTPDIPVSSTGPNSWISTNYKQQVPLCTKSCFVASEISIAYVNCIIYLNDLPSHLTFRLLTGHGPSTPS